MEAQKKEKKLIKYLDDLKFESFQISDDKDYYKQIEYMYKHEFTVTYNRKRIWDIPYAYTMTDFIIQDIESALSRYKKREIKKGAGEPCTVYNYVVEHHQDGWPHVHGTYYTSHIQPSVHTSNLEALLSRKYGFSDIYCTGLIDKFHPKSGLKWSEYIKKEGVVKYYFYTRPQDII